MTTPGKAPSEAKPNAPRAQRGHPKGLYVLFFTEMWERFSYYGMRALLVLYMVNYFRWSQEKASGIYKWYTSFVYLTPILGGYLADRYLGNKRAVIIGASLMAIGHFLMAFEAVAIFYVALVFIVAGNGMFKPNMSTQVGRLYPDGDGRKDGAYTIFYMGINLGAFISPIVVGYLHDKYSFHWGFAAAGVGMLIGLVTYLVGLPWVKEISGKAVPTPGTVTEADLAALPPASPLLNRVAPSLVLGLGAAILLGAAAFYAAHKLARDNLGGAVIGTAVTVLACFILRQVEGARRDRVMVIFILTSWAVFFWAAFEQAGNAMNLWADQTTQRFITEVARVPAAFPKEAVPVGFPALAHAAAPPVPLAEWWRGLWNPVSTEWFQSINSLAVFTMAPLFAWLWTFLDRRRRNPSIPAKMATGVLLMGSAFGLMIFAARQEDQKTAAPLAALPPEIVAMPEGYLAYHDAPEWSGEVGDGSPDKRLVPAQGQRLFYADGVLSMRGVLPDVERDRLLRATAPRSFVIAVEELAKKSQEAKLAATGETFRAEVTLPEVPRGFELRYTGFNARNLHFDPATRRLAIENIVLADKDYKAVLLAGAEPAFRDAVNQLYVASAKHKVGAWWLVWFYVLSTLGELCLSPVGLSMVSKLAPAKFATMLMGLWLLNNFFGNFVAGALGEIWGSVTPASYFALLAAVLAGASMLMYMLVRRVVAMMHGVT